MSGTRYGGRRASRGLLVSLNLLVIGTSLGQQADLPTSRPAGEALASSEPTLALYPEVRLAQRLNPPTQPVWAWFILHTDSEGSVQIGSYPVDEAVELPLDVVLGTPSEPALFITYNNEPPVAVRPPTTPTSAARPATLTIAGNTSLGRRVDLRDIHRHVRYPGNYVLEWRPLGGRIGSASATFRVEPRKRAVIVTDYGKLTFRLDYDHAPRNVENFLDLAREGFYDGKSFHRLIPDFVLQGGCPLGTGAGVRPDGKLVPAEFHDAPFEPGTLAMARKPDDPNSASCQFFITLARVPELDGQYTVIGQARDDESLRTLRQIAGLSTDARDRPLQPLVIRSINLIDDEPPRRRDMGPSP